MYNIFKKVLSITNQLLNDENRDLPPNPIVPEVKQPRADTSLAAGKNSIENITPLRLDLCGQTPHPTKSDEMTIKYICSQFGLIKKFDWTLDKDNGHLLFSLPASPILGIDDYNSQTKSGQQVYDIPPIGVISSLFAYWRGSLEFRFDFVATSFHVGSLLIGYVPNVTGDVTLSQLKGGICTEYTIKAGLNQINFSVPYIADTTFWPTNMSTGVKKEMIHAPGKIFVFVESQLCVTNVVPDTIEVFYYMRGGPDFEVAIPCQPSIGLGWDPFIHNKPGQIITPTSGYSPFYLDSWNDFYSGKKLVLRYGVGTNHIAQFEGLNRGCYYTVSDDMADKFPGTIKIGESLTVQFCKLIFVPLDVEDNYGAIYLAPVISSNTARDVWFVKDRTGTWQLRKQCAREYFLNKYLDNISQWTTTADVYLTVNYHSLTEEAPDGAGDSSDSFEELQAHAGDTDRDRVEQPVVITHSNAASNASNVLFGERFVDLKDLCRRYQRYNTVRLNTNTSLPQMSCSFPCMPQGLRLSKVTDVMANLCREGVIPIVASGYRYYRGGLRFKLIADTSVTNVWVQAKPNRFLRSDAPFTVTGTSRIDSILNHGYATAFFSAGVNPVMCIEVPCYFSGEYGLLQRPVLTNDDYIKKRKVRLHYSLAELSLASSYSNYQNPSVTVMYALADDCRFSVFQGFPPMLFLSSIED